MSRKLPESSIKSRTMRCIAFCLAMALPAASRAQTQCHIDPVTGQRVCTVAPESPAGARAPALDSRHLTLDAPAHCRIHVGDGNTGSGTLVAADDSLGVVLTCAHLFDGAAGRIVVTFPDGSRFGALLINRDPAHDLAALSIRRPAAAPIRVSDQDAAGTLTTCGFGPSGQFRAVRGHITGEATASGATYPALTIAGAVRPGDSGGAVLDAHGQLVGVVWGQRDGLTYATCGRPVREFLNRLSQERRVKSQEPAVDCGSRLSALDSRLDAIESRFQALDSSRVDTNQFARRTEFENRFKSLTAQFDALQSRLEQGTTRNPGFFHGLSIGKLLVGALGLSGPLAVAVLVTSTLAMRRPKLRAGKAPALDSPPIAVDSPPPPQRTVPETHYVSVEQDTFAKAHQWASEHVARKYPGATEVLQAQDSLIKQYLAAK